MPSACRSTTHCITTAMQSRTRAADKRKVTKDAGISARFTVDYGKRLCLDTWYGNIQQILSVGLRHNTFLSMSNDMTWVWLWRMLQYYKWPAANHQMQWRCFWLHDQLSLHQCRQDQCAKYYGKSPYSFSGTHETTPLKKVFWCVFFSHSAGACDSGCTTRSGDTDLWCSHSVHMTPYQHWVVLVDLINFSQVMLYCLQDQYRPFHARLISFLMYIYM